MTSPALLTKELESAMAKLRDMRDNPTWPVPARITAPQATALLAHIAALEQRVEELEPAAECWAALSACARIKLMGAAGLSQDSPYNTPTYGHIGLEFWTEHEAKGDAQDLNGRDWFCRFMMKALAAYRALPKETPR